MGDRSVLQTAGEAWGIVKRARNFREVAKVVLPRKLRGVHVLNPDPAELPAGEGHPYVAHALRSLRNRLKGEVVADGTVDYAQLRHTDLFDELRTAAGLLHSINATDFTSDAERIAFWVNLYNVITIHGVIDLGIEESVMEIPSFFGWVAYRVGDQLFTPDDIEHGVLRRNAKNPMGPGAMFGRADERLAFLPDTLDPRIHAALVCVSKSCPPIGFYDAEYLDQQLGIASRNLVNEGVSVDHAERRIVAPAIFDWYADDFGGSDGVAEFLIENADEEQAEQIRGAQESGYRYRFPRWDWSLNAMT